METNNFAKQEKVFKMFPCDSRAFTAQHEREQQLEIKQNWSDGTRESHKLQQKINVLRD